jgi:hypothetical protein
VLSGLAPGSISELQFTFGQAEAEFRWRNSYNIREDSALGLFKRKVKGKTPDDADSLIWRSRQDVTLEENDLAPMQLMSKETASLSKITNEIPAPVPQFRRLVNAVDVGDLPGTLSELVKLGLEAPRLGNILVYANLSADCDSPQFVGQATAERWQSRGKGVVSEQRLYSLIGLAWRRRHFLIYNLLMKFDSYAKSGLLRYMFCEHIIWNETAMKAMKDTSTLPDTTQSIILGYTDTFFPYSPGNVYKQRSDSVEALILSEDATMNILTNNGTYQLLRAERIPPGTSVYRPYDHCKLP